MKNFLNLFQITPNLSKNEFLCEFERNKWTGSLLEENPKELKDLEDARYSMRVKYAGKKDVTKTMIPEGEKILKIIMFYIPEKQILRLRLFSSHMRDFVTKFIQNKVSINLMACKNKRGESIVPEWVRRCQIVSSIHVGASRERFRSILSSMHSIEHFVYNGKYFKDSGDSFFSYKCFDKMKYLQIKNKIDPGIDRLEIEAIWFINIASMRPLRNSIIKKSRILMFTDLFFTPDDTLDIILKNNNSTLRVS